MVRLRRRLGYDIPPALHSTSVPQPNSQLMLHAARRGAPVTNHTYITHPGAAAVVDVSSSRQGAPSTRTTVGLHTWIGSQRACCIAHTLRPVGFAIAKRRARYVRPFPCPSTTWVVDHCMCVPLPCASSLATPASAVHEQVVAVAGPAETAAEGRHSASAQRPAARALARCLPVSAQ